MTRPEGVAALDVDDEEQGVVIEGEMMPPDMEVAPFTERRTVEDFVGWIGASWRSSMEGILETGRRLKVAKDALPHGEFVRMIGSELPFGDDTSQRLMKIAACPHFSNTDPDRYLPNSWTILYEIVGFSKREFDKFVKGGLINKNTTRNEIMELKRELRNPSQPKKSLGSRAIQQPVSYTLRLSHGEAVMLRDLFHSANQLGMVDKWLQQNFPAPGTGLDTAKLSKKFGDLNLPELPVATGKKGK
ncbi:MAG: DUF3102 domain-containing protein [Magnetococcus sp. MYC-9]